MRTHKSIAATFVPVMLLFCVAGTPLFAADRHAGFYYPEPQTHGLYEARSDILREADRGMRIDFVNGLTAQIVGSPYPPQFAIFAKGDEAEKLIIVGLYDHGYNTIFRARALLAMLTATARRTPFFQEHDVGDHLTFFDLLALLGFEQLTISDGDTFAHQVTFK